MEHSPAQWQRHRRKTAANKGNASLDQRVDCTPAKWVSPSDKDVISLTCLVRAPYFLPCPLFIPARAPRGSLPTSLAHGSIPLAISSAPLVAPPDTLLHCVCPNAFSSTVSLSLRSLLTRHLVTQFFPYHPFSSALPTPPCQLPTAADTHICLFGWLFCFLHPIPDRL